MTKPRPEHKTLNLPERQSLTEVIFEQLERMILSGVLKPGDPINEKAMSESNGLSRAPIREACRRLEQAGLVEILVNRGAFVRTISKRSAAELCEIRIVLASHAGRLAAKRIPDAGIEEVASLMQAIEASIAAGNLAEFYRLNHAFHMGIIAGAGNARLVELYEALAKELNLFRWRALATRADLDEAATAHRDIVDGLRARSATRLVTAMSRHLEAANRRLLASVADTAEEAAGRG